MDLPHVVILQKNHLYLKERLQVDPVLDALYQESIFTQADYDRCRQAGTEKCEMVLETLKKKGLEGYKTLCAVLDTTQPFIKERLDKTSTESGSPDLVYVNKGELDAQHKRELAKQDGEIADLTSSIEELQQQVEQNNVDHAELEERMKKEKDEHISEIEKKNEEIETLKTALSKSKDELQQSHAKCDELEKKLQEEQEAYDALVDVPRSQSPVRVDNTEQIQHADLQKWNRQLTLKEEDTRKVMQVHEGRWRQLGEIIHRITGTVPCTSESQRLRPEQLTSQEDEPEQPTSQEAESGTLTSHDVFQAAKHFILGAFTPLVSPGGGLCLKGFSGTVHIISKKRGSRFITCPQLQLDGDVANTDECHVTSGGELINSPPATQHTDRTRLQRLRGTCSSTPIPLPPSPFSVNPVSPTTRYWEAHTRVGVLCVLDGEWWLPVLEVGVGEESQVDSGWYVCTQRRSWCVSIGRCVTHKGSLCTKVYMAGEEGKCYRKTISDTPGTQATLHYGVVLDVGRGRIGFIDIGRSVVLGKVDVKFKENLLPVFGVCPLSVYYTVNMKVVSGEEILMSDKKKSLINEALE